MKDYHTALERIRDPESWDYSEKTDDQLVELYHEFQKQWDSHKWRKGEYYDRFHYKLLNRLGITSDEYRAGGELCHT